MALEFQLINDPDSTIYRKVRIVSQAYQIGDSVQQDRAADGADVVPATSATTTAGIYAVAVENKLSTDTDLLVAVVTTRQTWAADTTNTPNLTHNFQRMALTDKGTVNNTGTDVSGNTGVFEQMGIQGNFTNRIVGRFLPNANV